MPLAPGSRLGYARTDDSRTLRRSPGFRVWTSVILTALLASSFSARAAGAELTLEAVSTRPDMVTGGDVMLRVRGALPSETHFDMDHGQVSSLHPQADGSFLVLIHGLVAGQNEVTAKAGDESSSLTLTNHPITGPVFSGPHQHPFICETEAAGLGTALDNDCSAETRIQYFYRSIAGAAFLPLADPDAPYPPNMATTTTTDGRTVPYVVRVTSGTINRAVYRTAILDDPHVRAADDRFVPGSGWNTKLVYVFGGGCGTGYHQGTIPLDPVAVPLDASVLNDAFLARGYAVAGSSLNVLGNACNAVLSAETLMMVKEHFVEEIGVPLFTIGFGASGGAIQQYMIATAYPGLLDGLMPVGMFPDVPTTALDVYDCKLLVRLFNADPARWSEKRHSIAGHQNAAACVEWDAQIGPTIEASNCPAVIPSNQVYDPVSNPKGARCTLQDSLKNIYGVDPQSGFGQRWFDNVGVQYGLEALSSGAITVEDFIALNAGVGGFDIDGNPTPQRSAGNPGAIVAAYRSGQVVTGSGGLSSVPVIDMSGYLAQAVEEAHDRVRPYMLRARLARTDSSLLGRHVMWVGGGPAILVDGAQEGPDEVEGRVPPALSLLDRWLTTVLADASNDTQADKVARARPADAVDQCVLAHGVVLQEPATYGSTGVCNTLFPIHTSPRQVAGGPLSHDVLKCELKQIDFADYRVTFTSEQQAQLRSILSTGVCNNVVPGIGVEAIAGTWQRY